MGTRRPAGIRSTQGLFSTFSDRPTYQDLFFSPLRKNVRRFVLHKSTTYKVNVRENNIHFCNDTSSCRRSALQRQRDEHREHWNSAQRVWSVVDICRITMVHIMTYVERVSRLTTHRVHHPAWYFSVWWWTLSSLLCTDLTLTAVKHWNKMLFAKPAPNWSPNIQDSNTVMHYRNEPIRSQSQL